MLSAAIAENKLMHSALRSASAFASSSLVIASSPSHHFSSLSLMTLFKGGGAPPPPVLPSTIVRLLDVEDSAAMKLRAALSLFFVSGGGLSSIGTLEQRSLTVHNK